MIFIRSAMLSIALLCIATPARAQSRHEIGLGDVYGISNAPTVTAANALADAAQTRIASAKRPPIRSCRLGFMNRSLPSLAPMDPLGMTQIQLMQMVPLPGKLRLSGRIAADNAAAARARAADVRWDARAKAAMAFYDLYAAGARLVIARDTTARAVSPAVRAARRGGAERPVATPRRRTRAMDHRWISSARTSSRRSPVAQRLVRTPEPRKRAHAAGVERTPIDRRRCASEPRLPRADGFPPARPLRVQSRWGLACREHILIGRPLDARQLVASVGRAAASCQRE